MAALASGLPVTLPWSHLFLPASIDAPVSFLCLVLRLRIKRVAATAPNAIPTIAAPTPMPACAPTERPLGVGEFVAAEDDEPELGDEVGVVEDEILLPLDEAAVEAGDSRPTVVAARWETSNDHSSLLAPPPTVAVELGFRSNQHGVSEPGQSSLTVAVLLRLPTPCFCFSTPGTFKLGSQRLVLDARQYSCEPAHSPETLPSASSQNVKSQGSVKFEMYWTCT